VILWNCPTADQELPSSQVDNMIGELVSEFA
jgi:hypothetical protein